MRTTINIDPHLLQQAREQATLSKRSLSALISDALREKLQRHQGPSRSPVKLPTVKGELRPGIDYGSYADLDELSADKSDA